VRVHIILQGAEVILICWVAGILAGALHALGLAGEAQRNTVHQPSASQALAA